MSHHGIHLPPMLLPLQAPVKLHKKRRLRKKSAAGVSSAREAGEIGGIDELFMMEDDAGDDTDYGDIDDMDTGHLLMNSFSGTTMRTLLEAQEER